MNHLLRLLAVCGLIAFAVLMFAVGMARNTANLLAPVHLFMFFVAIAVYLFPTALALYRDCRSTVWIVAVNVLLGWTIIGWFAALGWATACRVRNLPVIPPPVGGGLPIHR